MDISKYIRYVSIDNNVVIIFFNKKYDLVEDKIKKKIMNLNYQIPDSGKTIIILSKSDDLIGLFQCDSYINIITVYPIVCKEEYESLCFSYILEVTKVFIDEKRLGYELMNAVGYTIYLYSHRLCSMPMATDTWKITSETILLSSLPSIEGRITLYREYKYKFTDEDTEHNICSNKKEPPVPLSLSKNVSHITPLFHPQPRCPIIPTTFVYDFQ